MLASKLIPMLTVATAGLIGTVPLTRTALGQSSGGSSTASSVDQASVTALTKMGAYLRGLPAFQVRAEVTTEDVLSDGQKIEYSTTTDLVARKPDKIRAHVTDERQERLFLYDGKNFTLFAPRPNYYATVPAPATADELIRRLEEKYDIEV